MTTNSDVEQLDNLDHIFTTLLDPGLNDFQVWALQHPNDNLSKSILPLISLVEGWLANEPTYLNSKRQEFGPNFCCAGQVVLGEFETIAAALTSPQARTWRLGTTILDANAAPERDVGGRNVFLLSLSDESAGGNGDREAFRKCMQDYLLDESASARQQDPIAKGLLNKLAEDYRQLPHDRDRENLCPYHMGFHSVGDRSAGRICPGKDVALDMLVDILVTVGKVRRG